MGAGERRSYGVGDGSGGRVAGEKVSCQEC